MFEAVAIAHGAFTFCSEVSRPVFPGTPRIDLSK